MSRAQIEKDLRELYGERHLKQHLKEYYLTKRKEMVILLAAVIVIIILSFIFEYQQTKIENNILYRNSKGVGKQEYQLEIKLGEEKWQPFSVILDEKEYTNEELDYLADIAMQEIPKEILDENTDLNNVGTNLNLMTQIGEYPFSIQWESSDPEKLENDGTLNLENITKEETIELRAVFQYEQWVKENSISLTLIPKNKENDLYALSESIQKSQSENRERKEFTLPDIYNDKLIQWKYPLNNSTRVIILIFLLVVPFISYQKDMEVHRKVKVRKEQLLYTFSEFISRFILYIEAGMSVKNALMRMDRENKTNDYLYQEVSFICRQMRNGLPEKDGYELLAKRCNLPCYRKLSSLLIQHVEKGSITILDNLRIEAKKAQEEQKGRIQKKGEEISTKLLFPMIIMLGIVMVFIMVPALFSFQI